MAFRRFSYSKNNPNMFLVTGLDQTRDSRSQSTSSLSDRDVEAEDDDYLEEKEVTLVIVPSFNSLIICSSCHFLQEL